MCSPGDTSRYTITNRDNCINVLLYSSQNARGLAPRYRFGASLPKQCDAVWSAIERPGAGVGTQPLGPGMADLDFKACRDWRSGSCPVMVVGLFVIGRSPLVCRFGWLECAFHLIVRKRKTKRLPGSCAGVCTGGGGGEGGGTRQTP